MPKVMNMPKIGVNMTSAKIMKWVVKEGDTVKEGDHILDAETDKAVQEIYATLSGVIGRILAPEDTDIECQSPIALMLEPGEKIEKETAGKSAGNIELPDQDRTVQAASVVGERTYPMKLLPGRIRISPLAKKLAQERNIPLSELQPSIPGARIVKADVLAYASARNSDREAVGTPAGGSIPDSPACETIPYTGIRKLIGDRMTESVQTKPSVALTLHAQVEKLIAWKEQLKKDGKAVTYNDIMVMIAAKALKEYPLLNTRLAGNEIQLLQGIHIGVAVDTEKGLVVPVIKNADQKRLLEIHEDLGRKVEAIKSGKASVEDLTGGTFTLTNLGMYQIEQFTPIINPPECCILALGAILREPVVGEGDTIEIRSRMQLTLAFDHRIVDGAPAAKFLQRVKHLIEWPMDLLN